MTTQAPDTYLSTRTAARLSGLSMQTLHLLTATRIIGSAGWRGFRNSGHRWAEVDLPVLATLRPLLSAIVHTGRASNLRRVQPAVLALRAAQSAGFALGHGAAAWLATDLEGAAVLDWTAGAALERLEARSSGTLAVVVRVAKQEAAP